MKNETNCNSENCRCPSATQASDLTINDVCNSESLEETANTKQEAENTSLSEITYLPEWIEMTGSVFNQIKYTVGKEHAETGGILGMTEDGNVIDHFFFDSIPEGATPGTYSPNCAAINTCLMNRWTPENIIYMGAIHSHPIGYTVPSFPDKEYAKRLLDNNKNFDKAKPYFYIPIVESSADARTFKIYSYIAYYKSNEVFTVEPIDLYIDGQKYEPNINIPLNNFVRIHSILPSEIIDKKFVIIIGAGGARDYAQDLARSGVKNFVLFDGD